ncbi:hypothetical protein HYX19_00730 [Candidatus Woesearchaeota archaeon]|nr:hypothetical protein [Candidatus Woesearchaeota archaeon]
MKERFLVVLMFLLILPLSAATIVIDNTDRLKYNIGDEIKITGHITETADFNGLFSLAINCGDGNFKLPSISLSLNKDEKKLFPSQFNIPKIVVSNLLSGNCFIDASLRNNDIILDSGKSNTFDITRELNGNFKVDKPSVQLGTPFTIEGDISKLNNKLIDGSAEIYLKSNNVSSFLLDLADIKNGKFTYTYTPLSNPAGEYSIDLAATDLYGNKQLFRDAVKINILSSLEIKANLDKFNLLPEEDLEISGEVYDSFNNKINGGNVKIKIGEEVTVQKLYKSKFDETINLAKNIKSGKQVVSISVEDSLGNKGYKELEFNVIPVPSRLELSLNNKKFRPGDVVEVMPGLYDQANSIIEDDIPVEILDADGNSLVKDTIKTNNVLSYKLKDLALPGNYAVNANFKKLEAEDSFEVEYITNIEIKLANQTILLKNKGNVEYDKSLSVSFDNGKYYTTKKLSMDPGELFSLNLGDYVPTGNYVVEVTSGDGRAVFNVPIFGKEIVSFDRAYQIAAILVMFLTVYLFITKFNFTKHRGKEHESEVRLARVNKERILMKKGKEDQKPFQYSAGNYNKEEAMKDYKERVVRDIQSTQESNRLRSRLAGESYPRTESSYTRNREEERKKEEPKMKEGLFNMFD